jgi:predicted acyltransferase
MTTPGSISGNANRQRFQSLDVFRGATVAFMILVNNPGSWSAMYEPLQHAKWHGCTPTDLVFPFFLFAVGNALAMVMRSLQPWDDHVVWLRIAKRTALIFLIGLLLNASPFVQWSKENELILKEFSQLRFLGVLQRIALSFGAAAILVRIFARNGEIVRISWITAGILVGYWIACLLLGASDPYSLEGYFGTWIDRQLLGESHLYHGEGVAFDPEGFASTLPSIAQVLLGWIVGQTILSNKLSYELIGKLTLFACYLLFLAWVWQLTFPLNKKIWTSTFVLFTTGLATLFLSTLIHWIDLYNASHPDLHRPVWHRIVRSPIAWVTSIFESFGKNPLFIFVLSGLLPRVLGLLHWKTGSYEDGTTAWTSTLPWLYSNFFKTISTDQRLGSLLYSIALLAFYACIVWVLDKRKIYIRV